MNGNDVKRGTFLYYLNLHIFSVLLREKDVPLLTEDVILRKAEIPNGIKRGTFLYYQH